MSLADWLMLRLLTRLVRACVTPDPDALIDTLIKPLDVRYVGCDEALRQRTAKRRDAAAAIRTRAAHVESGSSAGDVLRMARKSA